MRLYEAFKALECLIESYEALSRPLEASPLKGKGLDLWSTSQLAFTAET
jgi:hypothetical protein